jgi:hypothetical protein
MARARDKDVVDLLIDQHNEIKDLFTRVVSAGGTRRRELFRDLVRLLTAHEAAEEEIVHPMARRKIDRGDRVIRERLREEREAKHALAELVRLGPDHPEFEQKCSALAEMVIAHATQEETEEFPAMRENIPADQLRKMAGAFRTAEAMAPTRPHPAAGESALANMLAGPPLAIVDRIQDALQRWRQSRGG